MTRKRLLAFVALAMCIGAAGAQTASGRITFEGRIVQPTCHAELPVLAHGDGCGQEGVRSIDTESMLPAALAADSAMLDYFLERTKDDAKFALMRQYR